MIFRCSQKIRVGIAGIDYTFEEIKKGGAFIK
jgi:hypothetical protein